MAFSFQSTLDNLTPIAPQQALLQQQLQQTATMVPPSSVPKLNNMNSDNVLSDCKLSTTFNWHIKEFQHFYRNPTHCQTVWSTAFYSPSLSPSTINLDNNSDGKMMVLDVPNNLSGNNFAINSTSTSSITTDSSNGCAWRMCMFPHGYKTEQYLSLFLYAFQTDYEKIHGIQSRAIKYVFELFKVHTNTITSKIELKPIDVSQTNFKKSFSLDQKGDSGGKAKFSELTNLFPNNDTTVKVEIMIRVKLYIEDDSNNNNIVNSSFNNVHNKFQPSFENYFDNDNFSDVVFSFSDESEIKASRLALSIRSNYFYRMFNGEWAESKAATIRVKNVTYHCFKSLIYFLYTGVLNDDLPFSVLIDLCIEADIRDVPELGELVVSRIINQANNDNWVEILLLGWKIKNLSLKNSTLQYIHDNWENIKRERKIYDLMSCADVELVEEIMFAKYFGIIKYEN